MVHNGIEYGIMQAYAEGFNILHEANAGAAYVAAGDAEVAPMDNPADYQYDINVAEVAELWRRGSVVGSWLLDLTATVLRGDREALANSMEEYQTVVRVVGLFTLLWIGVPSLLSAVRCETILSRAVLVLSNQGFEWNEGLCLVVMTFADVLLWGAIPFCTIHNIFRVTKR